MITENNHVDITKKSEVTCVEWFHGYGGNALGLKRAIPGLRSIAVCERDAFVVANMVSKMEKGLLDAVPIWTDVTDFPTEPFSRGVLDIFVASYPCQGFSHAGKRLGVDDHRHLWPYCRGFIRTVRPGWVWLENVEGHVSLGLSTVLADLEEDGYTAAWGIFSASEIGAPHQRKRVFILAYRNDGGLNRQSICPEQPWGAEAFSTGEGANEDVADGAQQLRDGTGELSAGRSESTDESSELANHRGGGREDGISELGQRESGYTEEPGNRSQVWPSRPGASQYGWEPPRVVENPVQQRVQRGAGITGGNDCCRPDGETALSGGGREDRGADNSQTQSPLGGNVDGPADGVDFTRCTGLSNTELEEVYGWMVKGTNRTDELRMCGNGVVPATAERAFRTLFAELTRPAGTDVSILKD
jgi:DNA (cytosine-5)-methyltransferase 1